MKKIYLMALALFFGPYLMAQVSVTFQVDMSNETVSPNGVHVAGDWQDEAGYTGDWDPSSAEMTDSDGDDIYTLTVTLSDPGQYEYKFVNGNNWDNPENVPLINQKGGGNSNRVFVADAYSVANGLTLPAVTFSGSAPAGQVAVRFVVDMAAQGAISEDGVHVAGDFTDPQWTPGFGAMFNSTNSKYAYVGHVAPNASYNYKFVNGNDWGMDEWNGSTAPEECTDGGNRFVTVISEDVLLDAVCYESCSTCAPLTDITFRVDMSGVGGGNPDGVSIAGSFQGWSPGVTLMTDDDADGIYEVTLSLEQGTYEYKFVNGLTWDGGESVPGSCNVNGNRQVIVGAEPSVEAYCFSQCASECIPDPEPSDITFRVNMQNETVAAEGVWVMGGFTNPQWQSGAIEMTDANGDGIYEVTVTDVSGPSEIQYKFANGDPTAVEEDGNFLEGGCGVSNGIGGYNRVLNRTAQDTILPVVCYNSCSDCGTGVQEADLGRVSIYPNPAKEHTVISVQNPNGYTLKMSVVDITGKTVRDNILIRSSQYVLNTSDLKPGLYFLNIVSHENGRAVYKLMVD